MLSHVLLGPRTLDWFVQHVKRHVIHRLDRLKTLCYKDKEPQRRISDGIIQLLYARGTTCHS
jgi:hypothetical protein